MSFETGRIAKQAAGAVMARYGDTMVLSTICSGPSRPGTDFFPLTVDYREKTYAAGKFPGGFIKREGRPKDKEILTMRMIDRPLRPLWPEGYNDEVQVMTMVVSADKENDPDLLAMNASFAASYISDLPFKGPIAAVRVGRIDGKWVAFPTLQQLDESDVEIIFVASRKALVMVEGKAQEITEPDFLLCLEFGTGVMNEILDMMDELRTKSGAKASTWVAPVVEKLPIHDQVLKKQETAMKKALLVQGKHERYAAIKQLKTDVLAALVPADDDGTIRTAVSAALKELETRTIRRLIVKDKKRIDLRKPTDIRQITGEVGFLPRTHGSALFTRGETQAIVVATLGTPRDQQIVDDLMEEYSKKYTLQYNFPPYSVGEVKPLRGVGRREIGHGFLAERATAAVVPSDEVFPYTIRIVSDITESNGSSSMASVCGATLAMMDAGVPIRQPVAGIAMGLVEEGKDVVVLSDILGTEDHVGDMDFKVAGTGRGITAVQMDIKMQGLSREILEKALEQARVGRIHILREMMKILTSPRSDISTHAPRLLRIQIPAEKIGMVIGPGGKTIKRIQEDTGATIEIEDDGTVIISCLDAAAAHAAKGMIDQLTAEVEVGRIYQGRVVSIKDFGAFVEVLPGQEGLCHVSELDVDHVREVGDVVSVGDIIPVKILLRDEQGRLKLSRRAALQELNGNAGGAEMEDADAEEEGEDLVQYDDQGFESPRRSRTPASDRGPRPERSSRPQRSGPPADRGRGPARGAPRGGGGDRGNDRGSERGGARGGGRPG
jgi:polyribonucleotide nucleotidyltransferase